MKKIYLTILAVAAYGVSHAQDATQTAPEASGTTEGLMELEAPRNSEPMAIQRGGSALWSEDFENGFNSENGDWTVGGTNGAVWDHVYSISAGCYAGGAEGSLDFTTQENGFMNFHADSVNCVDADTDPPTITQDAMVGELISPSIDLSGASAVSISFEHRFRHCCTGDLELLLSITNDGGDSWTDYDVLAGTAANVYNTNTTQQVNISPVAADQSDVQIKFTWSGQSHYTWSIDDINIFVPDDYDLGITTAGYTNFILDSAETYLDLPYTIYPISQLRELTFRTDVTNFGGLEQNDVQLQVIVTNDNDYEVTLLSDLTTLTPGEQSTITIPGYMPPAEVGEYTVSFTLLSGAEDFNPEDNVADDMIFRISESEFARDRYERTGEFTNFTDLYKIGNWFNILDSEDVYCLGVALSTSSDPGTFFSIQILENSPTELLSEFVGETMYVTVPPVEYLSEVGESNFTYIWMNESQAPQTLFEGDYFIAVNHDGGDDEVVVATSGTSTPQTSLLWDGTEGADGTWFYTTSTPMVRMGLSEEFCDNAIDETISIDEVEQVAAYQLFPNPTAGQTALEYTLLEKSEVQIMLFDINGRIILNEDMGTQQVGEYRMNYDLSDQAAGIYTLSLQVNGKSINKQLVIK